MDQNQCLTDKRNIFVVTLAGDFFCHYKLYIKERLQKHWSNETETLKLIDEVINPYVVKKRAESRVETRPNTKGLGYMGYDKSNGKVAFVTL